ncbi:ribonuclease H [Senna tora]|uniref:Ribonuclease H n=1 Tax=Senna tora TaxID=362788 RepID=A0A834T4G5_9FABA|nr:ribonuclease H [Senna tora]
MPEVHRVRRGFTTSDLCQRCGKDPEDVIHAVRDCKWVKQIWERLVHQNFHSKFFSSSIHEWIHDNLTLEMGKKIVYLGVPLLNSMLSQVNCYLDTNKVINPMNLVQDHVESNSSTWKAPNMGYVKINVDGSYGHHDDSISCGGSIRNSDGDWDKNLRRVVLESDSMQAIEFIKANCDVSYQCYVRLEGPCPGIEILPYFMCAETTMLWLTL